MRRASIFSGLALFLSLSTACLPAPVSAEGRYSRRQAARGEQTDTSPKLGTFAFINDREATSQRLALFVDAGGCRDPLLPDLVPLRIGMAYRGVGSPVELRPDRFRLSWDGAGEPLVALRQAQVLEIPRGRAALGQAGRSLRARHAPLPFDERDGRPVGTAFHVDPSAGVFLNEEVRMPQGSWFVDVVFFRLPEGFELWDRRLELAFVDPAGAELVDVAFRVEEDPERSRKAFRRAQKARKKQEKAARKAARKTSEREALEGSSTR